MVVLDLCYKTDCFQYQLENSCHTTQGVWDLQGLLLIMKVCVMLIDLIIVLYLIHLNAVCVSGEESVVDYSNSTDMVETNSKF